MESLQNTFLRANSFIDSFLWAASEGRGGWISEELTRCCKVVTSSAARSSNPGRDSMI